MSISKATKCPNRCPVILEPHASRNFSKRKHPQERVFPERNWCPETIVVLPQRQEHSQYAEEFFCFGALFITVKRPKV